MPGPPDGTMLKRRGHFFIRNHWHMPLAFDRPEQEPSRAPTAVCSGQVRDYDVFCGWITGYNRQVRAYCRSHSPEPGEVEDLVQSVWEIAWRHRSTYRAAGHVSAWLLRIARTVCYRAARARRPSCSLDLVSDTLVSEKSLPDRMVISGRVVQALRNLPPKQRMIVVVRLIYDLSTEDTARVCGCSVGTVKASLHQAILNLRQSLAGLQHDL